MNHWLVKSEPEAYSWQALVKDGRTAWTGVRNFAARNNLRAMKTGDVVFFYHSGGEKSIVGLARVAREFYPDPLARTKPLQRGEGPTADEGDWSAVDLVPVKPLARPVTLAQIKADEILREMKLVKQSRLSVLPVTREQFARLIEIVETKA